MRKFLYILTFTYYFLYTQIHVSSNDSQIIDQQILVHGSKLEPLHLLQNNSIYPFRIIQIGKIFDRISISLLNKTYYKYLIKACVEEYKKDKNLDNFINNIKEIKKNIKNTFFAKFGSKPPLYKYTQLKETTKKIKKYFESYGFLDVQIKKKVSTNNKKQVIITYFVEAGKKYKISSIEVICENLKLKQILDQYYLKPKLKKKQNVNFEKIQQEIKNIVNIFHNNGFLFFKENLVNVYVCKKAPKTEAEIIFKIDDNIDNCDQQFVYDKTKYKCIYKNKEHVANACYKLIKKKIIDNYLNFPRGRFYSRHYENGFYEYLYNTSIFKNVNIEKSLEQKNINNEVFLNLNKPFSLLLSPTFSFNKENIFFSVNSNFKFLNLCKILDVFEIKLDFECILIRFENQWSYFKKPNITFTTVFSYPFSFIFKRLKHQISTKYELKMKFNYDDKKKKNQNLFFLSSFLKYSIKILKKIDFLITANIFEFLKYKENSNIVKNINPNVELLFSYNPNEHFVTNIECNGGINKFLNDAVYLYLKVSFEQVFKIYFNYNHQLNMRFKIGKIFSKGNKFPDTVYFKIGGNRSLRGWDINDVGPGEAQYVDEYDKKGEIFILYNIEYNYRFNEVFSILCPFFDIGNVFKNKLDDVANSKEDEFYIKDFYKKLHINTGFALRITWKVFIIRRDIGFRIYEPTKPPIFGERYFSFIPNVNFCFGLPF